MGVPAPSGVEALTFLEMWREASSQTWDFWWEKWDDPLCSALPGCAVSLVFPRTANRPWHTACVDTPLTHFTLSLCTPTIQHFVYSYLQHTHKVKRDILCISRALHKCLCQQLVVVQSTLLPPQKSLVGAGCDGLLKLQVQGRRAEMKAAVAGLTDAAGLEQLLAWHWDLLVAAAGAEHITAVPAVRRRHIRGPDWYRAA